MPQASCLEPRAKSNLVAQAACLGYKHERKPNTPQSSCGARNPGPREPPRVSAPTPSNRMVLTISAQDKGNSMVTAPLSQKGNSMVTAPLSHNGGGVSLLGVFDGALG